MTTKEYLIKRGWIEEAPEWRDPVEDHGLWRHGEALRLQHWRDAARLDALTAANVELQAERDEYKERYACHDASLANALRREFLLQSQVEAMRQATGHLREQIQNIADYAREAAETQAMRLFWSGRVAAAEEILESYLPQVEAALTAQSGAQAGELSNTAPTRDGYYWFEGRIDGEQTSKPEIVELCDGSFYFTDENPGYPARLNLLEGKWFGPLTRTGEQ